jgi:cytochrome c-type biogenesis protein CcmE
MDPDRKRKIRLAVALTVAVLLGVALMYTSFSASTEAKQPADVLASGSVGETYQVTGQVISEKQGAPEGRDFVVADEEGRGETMRVLYPEGIIPDPFRVGRDVVITGQLNSDGHFEAQADSLITKCPSKFSDDVEDPTNVEFVD